MNVDLSLVDPSREVEDGVDADDDEEELHVVNDVVAGRTNVSSVAVVRVAKAELQFSPSNELLEGERRTSLHREKPIETMFVAVTMQLVDRPEDVRRSKAQRSETSEMSMLGRLEQADENNHLKRQTNGRICH